MKIEAEIKTVFNHRKNPLKAVAAVIFDGCFIIKSVRLVEGRNGLFVCMPSRMNAHGEYAEQCHPLTRECKREIDDAVITAYEKFTLGF